MTPRRIKRRSVMNRGTTGRASSSSRRSHHSSHRSSTRQSRRKVHQNPVTKLIDQQNSNKLPTFSRAPAPSGSDLTVSNLKSLNNDYITAPGPSSTRSDFRHSPDPIYYNMHSVTTTPHQQWSPSPTLPPTVGSASGGLSNPTYQHSTPNLSHSPEPIDEPYSNRPPSVRSSYSNFHGARPLSSYNPVTAVKENVFLGLNQQPSLPVNEPPSKPPPPHPKPYAHVQPQTQQPSISPYQAIPQVPQKIRNASASRESMNFLNSGPPAYNLNYHTPPDSETAM